MVRQIVSMAVDIKQPYPIRVRFTVAAISLVQSKIVHRGQVRREPGSIPGDMSRRYKKYAV